MKLLISDMCFTETRNSGVAKLMNVMMIVGILMVAIATVAPVLKFLALLFVYVLTPLLVGGGGALAVIWAALGCRKWLRMGA